MQSPEVPATSGLSGGELPAAPATQGVLSLQ